MKQEVEGTQLNPASQRQSNEDTVVPGDWCLAQWLFLSTSVVRTWGRIPLGQFLVTELKHSIPCEILCSLLGRAPGSGT